MSEIIDGRKIAEQLKLTVEQQVTALKQQSIFPCLAVVLLGKDPASKVYVGAKKKACEQVGILSKEYTLPEETSQQELLQLIQTLNQDKNVHGILVQLPLPKHMDAYGIIEAISPMKDVDAFHASNVGKVMIDNADFLPCTPAGCMKLIFSTGIDMTGKHAVVVGRSNIVGKPMSMLLLHQHATVTICHSKTTNLAEICSSADILIAAVGRPNFITAEMVKPGAVVIDVGINRLIDGSLCGDVDFESVRACAGFITPVPGGVGPMTIAMLMNNTVLATRLQQATAT